METKIVLKSKDGENEMKFSGDSIEMLALLTYAMHKLEQELHISHGVIDEVLSKYQKENRGECNERQN